MTQRTVSVLLFAFLFGFYNSGIALEIIGAEVFFDSDPGYGSGIPFIISEDSGVAFFDSISLGGLAPGDHTLFVRYRDDQGTWSVPIARRFGVMPPTGTGLDFVAAGEFFFDTDPGLGGGTPLLPEDGSFNEVEEGMSRLNAAAELDTGFHLLYTRIRDGCGLWSALIADTLRVIIAHSVVQSDSTGERVQVAWTNYPEAILYYVHYDSTLNGPFSTFLTVSPPETSLWVAACSGQCTRFFRVRALMPDPSRRQPDFFAKQNFPGERP